MKLTAVMILVLQALIADPRADDGLRQAARTMLASREADNRTMPTLGLAMSWASKDPVICAELKEMNPSAICAE